MVRDVDLPGRPVPKDGRHAVHQKTRAAGVAVWHLDDAPTMHIPHTDAHQASLRAIRAMSHCQTRAKLRQPNR